MKKTVFLWVCVMVVVLAAIFLLVRGNSLSLALRQVELDPGSLHVIHRGWDANGQEYQVLQTANSTGSLALVRCSRNVPGFWRVEDCNPVKDGERNYAQIGWMESGGVKRFIHTESPVFETEWHFAYSGNNALKLIELAPEQIPDNVTVNIQQAGALYWIYVISFAEPDVLNQFDVIGILRENGCIP